MCSTFVRLIVLFSILLSMMVQSCASSGFEKSPKTAQFIIPLLSILLDMDKPFRGKMIQTTGYMKQMENLYLFQDRDYAHINDMTMAITIGLSDGELGLMRSKCVGKFVQIVAKLEYRYSTERSLIDVQSVHFSAPDGQVFVCWVRSE